MRIKQTNDQTSSFMTEVYDRDNFADIEKIWESDLCLKPPLLEWRSNFASSCTDLMTSYITLLSPAYSASCMPNIFIQRPFYTQRFYDAGNLVKGCRAHGFEK